MVAINCCNKSELCNIPILLVDMNTKKQRLIVILILFKKKGPLKIVKSQKCLFLPLFGTLNDHVISY